MPRSGETAHSVLTYSRLTRDSLTTYSRLTYDLLATYSRLTYDLLATYLRLTYESFTTYRSDAALTHFGCMLSFPGSVVQPWHMDGPHLRSSGAPVISAAIRDHVIITWQIMSPSRRSNHVVIAQFTHVIIS